ncbi:hypothetical protein AAZX31_07G164900 [Glycine max]
MHFFQELSPRVFVEINCIPVKQRLRLHTCQPNEPAINSNLGKCNKLIHAICYFSFQ